MVAIIGVLFLALFVVSVFAPGGMDGDVFLMPSVVGVLWTSLFFVLVSGFAVIPEKPAAGTRFFARVKIRLKRGAYHLLALIFVVLSIAVVAMSVRMLGIWMREF
ncbi:MAG: hypothetical protein AB8G17_13060 [Gammaproteobacteria bacterium]